MGRPPLHDRARRSQGAGQRDRDRSWEALGAAEVPFSVEDRSEGWLALADPDQVDQVLWAILDNAVDYGGRTAIEVTISLDAPGR